MQRRFILDIHAFLRSINLAHESRQHLARADFNERFRAQVDQCTHTQALRSWARRTADTWPDDADVFAYFNNDQGGAAVHDAASFAAIVRRAGRRVSGTAVPGTGPGSAR